MPAPGTGLSYKYLTASEIEAKLRALASAAPQLCQVVELARTHENRLPVALRIKHPNAPANAIPVLFTAGIHAREWAPPDILLDFAARLIDAAGTGPDFPGKAVFYGPIVKWQLTGSPNTPYQRRKDTTIPVVNYKAVRVPRDAVRRILNKLEIIIAPLVNVDGRVYSQSIAPAAGQDAVWIWRKNRKPNGGASCVEPRTHLDLSVGTDINRNFDFAWDKHAYYSPTALGSEPISSGETPCEISMTYRGPSAASEIETQNVVKLMRDYRTQFYVDIHAYAHAIYHGWGTAQSGRDASQTYLNHADWDGKRFALDASKYGEFLPPPGPGRPGDTTFGLLAQTMRSSIEDAVDAARVTLTSGFPRRADPAFASRYNVGPATLDYAATGTAQDYHTSLQFTSDPAGHAIALDPVRFSYTIECGSKDEGAFWPERNNELPKISREVHAALWYLLSYAATPFGGSATWPIVPGTP